MKVSHPCTFGLLCSRRSILSRLTAATLVEEMINAEGFSLKLLLWTAKAAEEAGSDVLICTVYENLVFYSTRHDEVAVQVDCMVVFR